MNSAWVLSIGTELTLGQTVDTNGAWLARRLSAMGARTTRHVTVPDELADIRGVFTQAAASAELVLVTGGLGPTEDDLTRQALAEAAGVELRLDERCLAQIQAFFAARHREMPERNRVQAYVPYGGSPIENTCGTAPGVYLEIKGVPFYAMPGVPMEMRTMFERSIEPQLRMAAGGAALLSRRLHCIGAGESEIGERIRDRMQRGRNPEVGTTANMGIVGVRINARGLSPDAARGLLDHEEAEIRARLGTLIFGRDEETLAQVVGEALRSRNLTIATAESCTGGLIAKQLTDHAGSSAYFRGSVVAYANSVKERILGVPARLLAEHGAVSEAVCRAMAVAVRSRLHADVALGVTGIAGPDGGGSEKPVGTVFIGLATPEHASVKRYQFGSDAPRDVIRERAASTALNMLRLWLIENAGTGEVR